MNLTSPSAIIEFAFKSILLFHFYS